MGWGGAVGSGGWGVGKAEDGGPFAAAVGLPEDGAVEEVGGFFGGEVVVEVEVAGVGGLVAVAEIGGAGRGFPLGGEEEGGVVGGGGDVGVADLVEGEVGEADGADGVAGVAELGVLELGGGGPGGENGGVGEAAVDDGDGLLVEDDHVAVGEVVFGGEGVGRVAVDGGDKGEEGEGDDSVPEAEVTAELHDAEEEDEGVEGEEVAGEQGAAEDGELEEVGEEDDGEGEKGTAGEGMGLVAADGGEGGGGGGRATGTNMFMCTVRWRTRW